MRIQPAALATSIGSLTTLDVHEGFPEALQQVVEAAKLLFQADGAGLMLVGKDELLTWASASHPRPQGPPGRQRATGRYPVAAALEQAPSAVEAAGGRWRASGGHPVQA
jgi:hypothetical protein